MFTEFVHWPHGQETGPQRETGTAAAVKATEGNEGEGPNQGSVPGLRGYPRGYSIKRLQIGIETSKRSRRKEGEN